MCGYVQGDAGENPEERYSIFSDGLERLLAKKRSRRALCFGSKDYPLLVAHHTVCYGEGNVCGCRATRVCVARVSV